MSEKERVFFFRAILYYIMSHCIYVIGVYLLCRIVLYYVTLYLCYPVQCLFGSFFLFLFRFFFVWAKD